MIASSLQDIVETHGEAIDGEIRRWLELSRLAPELRGMLAYQLGYVNQRLQPDVSTTAKRFRPALCLVACRAVGRDPASALTAAAAIELLHNFSLVHDDIEDRDPVRRHRASLWKVWGEAQAINAGDAMFALAGKAIHAASPPSVDARGLCSAFQDTCLDLTNGQYLDMSFEDRLSVSTDEYRAMISLKSASLISFSLWAGAVIGGAGPQTCDALRRFGLEVGSAFQIWDDLLGIWGKEERTGKEEARDLRNRKKTLPLLLAQEHGTEADRAELLAFFSDRSLPVEPIVELLERIHVRSEVTSELESELRSGIACLDGADIDPSQRSLLSRLARELTGQGATN